MKESLQISHCPERSSDVVLLLFLDRRPQTYLYILSLPYQSRIPQRFLLTTVTQPTFNVAKSLVVIVRGITPFTVHFTSRRTFKLTWSLPTMSSVSETLSDISSVIVREAAQLMPSPKPTTTFLNRDIRNIIYDYMVLPRLIRTEEYKACIGLMLTCSQFKQEMDEEGLRQAWFYVHDMQKTFNTVNNMDELLKGTLRPGLLLAKSLKSKDDLMGLEHLALVARESISALQVSHLEPLLHLAINSLTLHFTGEKGALRPAENRRKAFSLINSLLDKAAIKNEQGSSAKYSLAVNNLTVSWDFRLEKDRKADGMPMPQLRDSLHYFLDPPAVKSKPSHPLYQRLAVCNADINEGLRGTVRLRNCRDQLFEVRELVENTSSFNPWWSRVVKKTVAVEYVGVEAEE
jgi:hypothetical protein